MPVRHEPPTIETFMEGVRKRNPGEGEFHQAVQEVAESIFRTSLTSRSTTTGKSYAESLSPIASLCFEFAGKTTTVRFA